MVSFHLLTRVDRIASECVYLGDSLGWVKGEGEWDFGSHNFVDLLNAGGSSSSWLLIEDHNTSKVIKEV